MNPLFPRLALALSLSITPITLLAVEPEIPVADTRAEVPAEIAQRLRDALARLLPERQISRIRATPVEHLYEVTNGGRVYYITGDGDHLITGHLIDTRESTDLSAQPIADAKAALLAGFGDDMTINYGSPDLPYEVVVFTDIDCPYCRQMHEQITAYNDAGIRVRYFLYPRAGLDSPAYAKARDVWCADDREAALTVAKNLLPVPERTCDDPIAEHMDLGAELGVNGTPTVLTRDARTIPGRLRAPTTLALVLAQIAAEDATDDEAEKAANTDAANAR